MGKVFRAKLRKVGTSVGVLIPKEIISEEKLKIGEEIEVGLMKKKRIELIEKAFGIAKGAGPFERDRRDRF